MSKMSRKSLSDLWILACALVLAWLISLTPPYQRLDFWLGDAQQSLVARETYFRDAFVIDIDEASLAALEPHLGAWPYSRDAYALVLDYLSDMGAEAVVFDIQLATPRDKDDAFAASMRRNGNAVLVASTPTSGAAMSAADKERLRQFAWRTPPNFSAHAWQTVLMPAPALTEKLSGVMQLGMVSLNEDADGVLRRIPLMHDIAGERLPSLPLAVLAHNRERTLEYDAAAGRALFGGASWPVDETGNFHLAYPRNANSVMTMPFRQVVEAALGKVHLEDEAKFFRGKTIFIGSSAQLSDRAVTPRGVMPGTAVLAIAHQSLKQNMLLAPQRAAWNGAMIALALLPVLVSILVFRREPRRVAMVMLSGIVAVYAANLLLLSRQQESVLLFPLLLIVLGWLLFTIRQQGMLRRHNVRLIGQTRALEQSNRELQTAASTDSLTGLLVRRAFLERCEAEIERAQRQERPLAMVVVDLDHFKQVNDTYGHAVGDLVLKRFADVLGRDLRTIDVAGRWGGEEFVVLMPETSAAQARNVIERIRVAVTKLTFSHPAENLAVTMSAGLVEFDGAMTDPEQLVAQADKALYEAKQAGRNRICLARSGDES